MKTENPIPSRLPWRLAFCEQDGMPSFARIATGVMVLAALGWVSFSVYKNHAIPSGGDLAGLGAFVTMLYGANKFATAIDKTPPAPPPAA